MGYLLLTSRTSKVSEISKMKNPTHTQFIFFLLFFLSPWFFSGGLMVMAQNTTIPVNVGVVLDLETMVGKTGLSSISMALSDFYASHGYYKTRLVLNTRDSKRNVVGAAAAALDLIKNVEVQAIIGPELSRQADFIIDLGDKAQVPIISFSATSDSLSSIRSPYFIRATQNDSSQVKALSAIIQAFGWREVVPIYVDNEYGEGVIPFLTDALQEIETCVPYRSVIPPSATDDQIVQELYKLMTMQTRVFIVHMLPALGSRLFQKAKEVGMMSEGYVWIITDGIGNLLGLMDPAVIDSMQGVLGVESYVPKTKELEDFSIRWKRKFQQDNPAILDAKLSIFGLWAYDATLALAMAVEKIGATNFGFQKMNISGNSTDLEAFGVSQNGPKLQQTLLSTTFKGLAGDFLFVGGQLQSSAFQIVNLIGNGRRGIGFWTPKDGLVRKLNFSNTSVYSTSKASLGVIIWPGETTSVPRGWVIPTNGKRLRIGVPMGNTFSEFVKVTRDPTTNATTVTGYCIDVFKAVVEALPYAVPYDFIPFQKPDGQKAGSYNDLVYQVYLQNYDAAVGDITIIANRSLYVDFTLPYTESGVSMIVPIKGNNRKNAWVFLKPLTWDLWVTTGCFFVFIGFVIWLLEHRINEDFRGPPSHQVGTMFWFSFSTMVFAQRERVLSNLARFVVIIWAFVVLILIQSYTASLTSMLTVEQLQPTVTDVTELIKKGENVGYLEGSFVYGLLQRMNFNKSKLIQYKTREGCDEAFSKGSANGGIAAAFDETPYMRIFLARYCSKYTMVGPVYKTDGFGFVFPRGSPLVPDVSRAILKVTEGDKMFEIKKAWFEQQSDCPETSTSVSSNSLSLDSFWGLFLIAAVAASLALIIFTTTFIYNHRYVLKHFDPRASLWRKIVVMIRYFDKKDISSHTFRKSDMRDRNGVDGVDHTASAVEASLNTNCPPSPLSLSNNVGNKSVAFGEQGTPPAKYGNSILNRETPQEIVSAIKLANPSEERLVTPDIVRVNN